MTATIALAPIRKTQMARRITRGGLTRSLECWGAETTDGVWAFEREDSPGTPWLIIDKASGQMVRLTSTLRACRQHVAAGHARRDLERLQAHERGEHDAARDSWCGRC